MSTNFSTFSPAARGEGGRRPDEGILVRLAPLTRCPNVNRRQPGVARALGARTPGYVLDAADAALEDETRAGYLSPSATYSSLVTRNALNAYDEASGVMRIGAIL